ncbi:MAG: glycosyltransferase [Pseudomonadota bacterium]
MTIRTLIEESVDVRLSTLLDQDAHEIGGQRSWTAKGSRLAYAARCHRAGLACDLALYDAVGVARAHPRLPVLNKSYGVWIHGVEVWDSLSADRERALRGADFVLVNSQFTLDRFNMLYPPLKNAHVVCLATEEDTAPPQARFDGPPTALLIGRSDKHNFRKGHKEVIESWAAVTAAVPGARLLLAGGGDGLDLLRETAAASSARGSIEVLGFVPEDDLPALWARAHVFVQPSWKEGFGLVYIEAMRHGLPVIASIHDAGREVNDDGVTGYNVDLSCPKSLADRLICLLRSPDAAQSMGAAGQERWRQQFRFSAFKKRLAGTLDAVMH